jgi:hypothetical protein
MLFNVIISRFFTKKQKKTGTGKPEKKAGKRENGKRRRP